MIWNMSIFTWPRRKPGSLWKKVLQRFWKCWGNIRNEVIWKWQGLWLSATFVVIYSFTAASKIYLIISKWNDKIILPNKICITNGRKCKVDNCGDCNGDSQNEICRECIEGFYLDKIQNKCVQQCKERMRADNLTWECRDEKANNIYWVVGSKSSCEGLCNLEKDIGRGMDCSCDFLCYRRGDCCKDVESKCTFNKNYNL